MGRLSILHASLVLRCTTPKIAPQWLPSAGGHGDGILEREAGELSNKAHQNSRVHEEGILSRLRGSSGIKLMFLWLLRRSGILSRLGGSRALASPVARVGSAPLPDALDMGGACEGIAVARLL
jgi:hypothetical protein